MANSSSSSRTSGKTTPTGSAKSQTKGSKVGAIAKSGTRAKKSDRFKVPGQLHKTSAKGR